MKIRTHSHSPSCKPSPSPKINTRNPPHLKEIQTNLFFFLNAKAPPNSPTSTNIKKETSDFSEGISLLSNSTNESFSCKRKENLLGCIKFLKSNPTDNCPNYLQHILSRKCSVYAIQPSNNNPFYSSNFISNSAFPPSHRPPPSSLTPPPLRSLLRADLNKLTPENFDIIKESLLKLAVDNLGLSSIEILAEMIMMKSWKEPKYAETYAKLCLFLENSQRLSVFDQEKKRNRNLFKSALLEKIQTAFEKEEGTRREEEGRREEKGGRINEEEDGRRSEEKGRRDRRKGNIRFISFLYLVGVLPKAVVNVCAKQLYEEFEEKWKDKEEAKAEDELEFLVLLFELVGKTMDERKKEEEEGKRKEGGGGRRREGGGRSRKEGGGKEEDFIEKLDEIKKKINISNRIRILIGNLVDRRSQNWEEKIKKEAPKTIKALHEEHQSEIDLINSRYNQPAKNEAFSRNKLEILISSSFNEFKKTNDLDQLLALLTKQGISNRTALFPLSFLENLTFLKIEQWNILWNVPLLLITRGCLSKKQFIQGFNQYLRKIWEFTPDNPLLIGFLVKMYLELMEKEGLGLKDLDLKLEEGGEFNEEIMESFREFVEEAKKRMGNRWGTEEEMIRLRLMD